MPGLPQPHKAKKNGFNYYGKNRTINTRTAKSSSSLTTTTQQAGQNASCPPCPGQMAQLRGICSVVGEAFRWICGFAAEIWATAPEDIGLYFEADEQEAYRSVLPFDRHNVGKDQTLGRGLFKGEQAGQEKPFFFKELGQ